MTSSLSSERCMSINQVKKDNRECFGQKNRRERERKREREREGCIWGTVRPINLCMHVCIYVCVCVHAYV